MNPSNSEIKVSLKILHRNLGQEYWSDYETLDQKFREAIGADPGDLAIAREQLELGKRVIILARCQG
jgi:hypothetical protein